ncbi:MAG: hypothetical protein KAR06_12070 [Deltaproteobacteria bacterium]|nr:hypothetical protein [Deltaproteobacteria bacterium]
MEMSVNKMSITVKSDKVDIYGALELHKAIKKFFDDGKDSLTISLSKVKTISTPAIQVILSAQKSFKKGLNIKKGTVSKEVKSDFETLGVSLN